MWRLHQIVFILIAVGLLLAARAVFSRVRRDYQRQGCLSPAVAGLQFGYFCAYALCSYVSLDSRLSNIQTATWSFAPAIVLISAGFAAVLLSMPALGRRSFGHEVGGLNTGGLYRYSRNPQLAGSFLFIVGYALLWPSWQGGLWAALWIPISGLMVRGEEEHLAEVFGQEYRDYCARTPRYIGLLKR